MTMTRTFAIATMVGLLLVSCALGPTAPPAGEQPPSLIGSWRGIPTYENGPAVQVIERVVTLTKSRYFLQVFVNKTFLFTLNGTWDLDNDALRVTHHRRFHRAHVPVEGRLDIP